MGLPNSTLLCQETVRTISILTNFHMDLALHLYNHTSELLLLEKSRKLWLAGMSACSKEVGFPCKL